jgi:hypothetical protein
LFGWWKGHTNRRLREFCLSKSPCFTLAEKSAELLNFVFTVPRLSSANTRILPRSEDTDRGVYLHFTLGIDSKGYIGFQISYQTPFCTMCSPGGCWNQLKNNNKKKRQDRKKRGIKRGTVLYRTGTRKAMISRGSRCCCLSDGYRYGPAGLKRGQSDGEITPANLSNDKAQATRKHTLVETQPTPILRDSHNLYFPSSGRDHSYYF